MAALGQPIRALAEKPDLRPDLLFAWDAFWSLSGDRQMGWASVGALAFAAVDRFADRHGISARDEFDRFHALLRAMDGTYRAWLAEKMPKPGKS